MRYSGGGSALMNEAASEVHMILVRLVDALRPVPGVIGLALGGSRARGTQALDSDIDLGIYYDPAQPLDVAVLNHVAATLDDGRRPELLTPMGGWGPWINGGGWLTIRGLAVD